MTLELLGLAPGEFRYPYPVHLRDRFVTRWGDFDMYFREGRYSTMGVLTIVLQPSVSAGGSRALLRYLTFHIIRGGPDVKWEYSEIVSSTLIDGRGRSRMLGSLVGTAKHAVSAYNLFLERGGAPKEYVGDAMARLM